MNKILILEPFYTNFHIDLARSLPGDIYSFVFNFGNVIYLRGAKKKIVHRKILSCQYSPGDLLIAKQTKSLYTETQRKLKCTEPSEADFQYMAKYISYLREFLIENKIDLVLMHNDLRWQHALSIKVCKELGVRYLVTERGLFRPDTTTVELVGVNAYSSLTRDANFYRSLIVEPFCLQSYKPNIRIKFFVNLKFFIFVILNKIGDLFKINSQLVNKRYHIRNYLSLFLKKKSGVNKCGLVGLPKKYIFVPLQVSTDTQILVHSEYVNMQEFISHVETTFYSIVSDYKLVFKAHPMEGRDVYLFDTRSIITYADTKALISGSEFIITINSTVGFEAIQEYKKVIVLGNAFYKIDGIAICCTTKSFKANLLNCLNGKLAIDNDLISKFIYYLRSEYQINGSLFNYDEKTFQSIKRFLANGH